MKSLVIKFLIAWSILSCSNSVAQTTVYCKPDPPGGTVDCEKSQIACCIVDNGKVHTKCINVPDGLTGDSLAENIMSQIDRSRGRMPSYEITHAKELLNKGSWKASLSMASFTVNIPEQVKKRINK